MPYLRHIIADSLPVNCFSLAVDETRAAFRILVPASTVPLAEDAKEYPLDELSTTAKLAETYVRPFQNRYYNVDGTNYCILVEAILDKSLSEFQRMWLPGAHFVFSFDGQRMLIDIKGGLTFFDHRNTAEYARSRGGLWLFDLWVRNPQDPVTNCARSITTTESSIVITNTETLGEKWAAKDVSAGGVSQWLNLGYELIPSAPSVAPDGWVDFTLRILDGKTGELADDVNWDNFIIEPVDGYCPHRRVAVVNGVGSFRMRALDLREGETMRVKVGVRFWQSRVESSVMVAEPT